MNKFFLALVTLVALLGFSGVSLATVGGPTLVYDLKFDAKTNSVYYTEQNAGGKGCPPELKAITLDTNISKVIYSCDDGLKQYNYGPGQQEKINQFTSVFSSLKPINLKKNGIEININKVGVQTLPGSPDYVLKTNFMADIFQGGSKKASIPFSGCSADQPLIVDGYALPGIQDKIVLLLSGKSDCFEGGYTGEFIHLVSGVEISDSAPLYEYKTNSPLVPHEGSLVAYVDSIEPQVVRMPASGSNPEPTDQIPTQEEAKDGLIIISAVLSALAFLVGLLLGRWRRKEPTPTITNSSQLPHERAEE